MASFNFTLSKHFNPAVWAQPCYPICLHRGEPSHTSTCDIMVYTGHSCHRPWRRVEDAAGSIQDQDNTTKAQSIHVLYLIPAMHFMSTLQSPRMFCGLRKQVTSKVWLIQNCCISISLMQEWKKSVFGDIQQNKLLKPLRKDIKHICQKGE